MENIQNREKYNQMQYKIERGLQLLLILTILYSCVDSPSKPVTVTLAPDEFVWAGVIRDGHKMPVS